MQTVATIEPQETTTNSELDPEIAVLIERYPKLDLIKQQFRRFWILFDELGEEVASAQISQNITNIRFTSETVLAIWLCCYASDCADVDEAWLEAFEYLMIDGSEDDDEDGESEE